MRIFNDRGFPKRSILSIPLLLAVVLGLVVLGTVPDTADAVKKKSKEQVGYLGVSLQKLTDEIKEGLDLKIQRGVLVNEVFVGSPADEAGIRDGDVIVAFDGTKVSTPKELIKLVQNSTVGDEVKLKVVREDDTKTIVVAIGERPEEFAYDISDELVVPRKWVSVFKPRAQLGVKVQDLEDSDLAEYFKVEKGKGVLVLSVNDDSAAEEAGVKAGDVIVELNDEDIESSGELIDEVQEMEKGDEFELVVVRQGRRMTLTGEIGETEGSSGFMMLGDRLHRPLDWAQRFHIDEDAFEGMNKDLKKGTYRFYVDRDELRDELEDLKAELEKLKDELKDKLKELEEE